MANEEPPVPSAEGDGIGIAGDPRRQAVAALRGYRYQLYASALAWLSLADGSILHLEVAEDYAISANAALQGVQVKDTAGSGSLTIRSPGIAAAIDALVDLLDRNPGRHVDLRYLTTSSIGLERAKGDRIGKEPALTYWRRAAAGSDVAPLRALLGKLKLSTKAQAFIDARNDEELRRDLLRRIQWDAGQPSLEALAADLEDGAAEFLASTSGVASDQAAILAELMVGRVLKTATDRKLCQLRRADLLKLGDQLSRVSVPRSLLQDLLNRGDRTTIVGDHRVLQPGMVAPSPLPMVERVTLAGDVKARLIGHQIALVVGSTGLGKTSLAEQVARDSGSPWLTAGFRDLELVPLLDRLSRIVSEVATQDIRLLLLDDVAFLDNPSMIAALHRLHELLKRRDGALLVTAARAPTRLTTKRICGDDESVVEVPYLTVDEVRQLIAQSGGPERWAGQIHRSAAGGHPQLVQAAILHLRSESWSRTALVALASGQSPDIAAEQKAASERMVAALPEGARSLLFRLSLIYGAFDRRLALLVGEAPPPLAMPGAELDRLAGPWIEPDASGTYRVSPLVIASGRLALGPGQQHEVHRVVAHALITAKKVSVLKSDPLYFHARESGEPKYLQAFAFSILTANADILDSLAAFTPLFLYEPIDRPLADDKLIAAQLRLGQLLIASAGGKNELAAALFDTLEKETRNFTDPANFELVILAKLLGQSPIAAWKPDWIELLLRFDELARGVDTLSALMEELAANPGFGKDPIAFLFMNQSMGIRSPDQLLKLIQKLDEIERERRSRLLSGFAGAPGDFSLPINQAWIKWSRGEDPQFERGIQEFREVAAIARRWGETLLAARAEVGAAILADEYLNDPERALALLDEAVALGGADDPVFDRARAKIEWRRSNHELALASYEESWKPDGTDHVERAYTAREAGISAARLERWSDAAAWFDRARAEAEQCPHKDMEVMTAGLIADRAQMLFIAGDKKAAIEAYGTALDALRLIDPDASTRAAHVHRVTLHALTWLLQYDRFSGPNLYELPPGACSNPEPHPQIGERPLAPIDLGWYLLSNVALATGADLALYRDVHEHLRDGPILMFEVQRPARLAELAIANGDVDGFVGLIEPFASAFDYMRTNSGRLEVEDVIHCTRGTPPQAPLTTGSDPALLRASSRMLLSGAAVLMLEGKIERMSQLLLEAASRLPALGRLTRVIGGGEALQEDDLLGTARILAQATRFEGSDPARLFEICALLALFARDNELRSALGPRLERWAIERWTSILQHHRFRLRNPSEVDRGVRGAFEQDRPPLSKVAAICLAALPGIPASLDDRLLRSLRELRDEGQAAAEAQPQEAPELAD